MRGERDRLTRLLAEIAGGGDCGNRRRWRWAPRWRLAAVAALRGDRAEAIRWYETAVASGRRDLAWDRFDPLFASIRDAGEFQRLSDARVRLAAAHADAEPVVQRLAPTWRIVDEQFGPLLTPPAFSDPPGWPARATR